MAGKTLDELKAQSKTLATGLSKGLRGKFNGAAINIGYGVAKDKDENMSLYFRIYTPDAPAADVEVFADAFLDAAKPDAAVIVKTVSFEPPLPENAAKATFDMGVAYVGPGIRNKT